MKIVVKKKIYIYMFNDLKRNIINCCGFIHTEFVNFINININIIL